MFYYRVNGLIWLHQVEENNLDVGIIGSEEEGGIQSDLFEIFVLGIDQQDDLRLVSLGVGVHLVHIAGRDSVVGGRVVAKQLPFRVGDDDAIRTVIGPAQDDIRFEQEGFSSGRLLEEVERAILGSYANILSCISANHPRDIALEDGFHREEERLGMSGPGQVGDGKSPKEDPVPVDGLLAVCIAFRCCTRSEVADEVRRAWNVLKYGEQLAGESPVGI